MSNDIETQINSYKESELKTGLKYKNMGNGPDEVREFIGQLNLSTPRSCNWGFLVHPLQVEDLELIDSTGWSGKWIKKHHDSLARYEEELKKPESDRNGKYYKRPNLIYSIINGIKEKIVGDAYCEINGKRNHGVFSLVPYLPEQFIEAQKQIKELSKDNGNKETFDTKNIYYSIIKSVENAIMLAKRYGAEYIGLGAYNSIITDSGNYIEKNKLGPVTPGSYVTAAGIYLGVLNVCRKLGINPKNATAAIIGATGSVGNPTSMMLAKHFKQIVICAKNMGRLRKFRLEIEKTNSNIPIFIETDINAAIKNANIVIFAVSALQNDLDIDISSFQQSAVCCDASRPLVVPYEAVSKRPDIFFMDGAIFEFPGKTSCPKILRMGTSNQGFGCLMETVIRSLEGETVSGGLGTIIDISEIERIIFILEKYNIKLAGYKFHNKAVNYKI